MNGSGIGAAAGATLLFLLVMFVLAGVLVGALARWALPGPDPMSWLATAGYGIGGSLLGGVVGMLIRLPTLLNFAVSVACAAGLIWYFRRRRKPVAPVTPPPPGSPPGPT